jgi:hypothetical protein
VAKHYLIFIHGMGEKKPDENPKNSYDRLWNLIRSQRKETDFEERFARINIDWHTDQLQTASNTLFDSAFPGLREEKLNPMNGIRGFMTFLMGDIIAYVSEDVNLIRRSVWQQIWTELEKPLKEEGATYSIIAHSLGTVIAFDYLFDLFKNNKLFVPELDSQARPEDQGLLPLTATPEEVVLLQKGFRHFFTFGSPIGLFMLRKGSLWLEGMPFETLYNPVRGEDRSWYNFWDGQDAIAYPLKDFFNRNPGNKACKLVDIPVETGFLVFDSHTRYWANRSLASYIADVLLKE